MAENSDIAGVGLKEAGGVKKTARPRPVVWALATLALVGSALLIQAAPVVAKAIRFRCAFPQPGTQEAFELEFTVDEATNRAFLVGNRGAAEVEVHRGFDAISFVEHVPSGAVQTTTIATDGQAVHSRHTLVAPDEFMASQVSGTCR